MEELKILKGNIVNLPQQLDNNSIYVATSSTSNQESEIIICGKEWMPKEYVDNSISEFVTAEEFSDTKTKADSALQANDMATINGESITSGGNISIDLSLYELVEQLPTENISTNKIYLVRGATTGLTNMYLEYLYHEEIGWELLGEYKAEINLDGYLKTADADKKYMKLSNGSSSVSVSTNGSVTNYGDNGQAYNAVRSCSASQTGKEINGASFGVKLDGTTAFSHKTYTTFNPSTGQYTGARNTAVLTFAGNLGLRYAKNTGAAADVTNEMYKYVGVIDSPDEFQRVYSKAQVDTLISKMKTILTRLGATQEEIDSITI